MALEFIAFVFIGIYFHTWHHLYLTVHQEKSRANSRRYIKSTNNVGFVNFTSVIGDFDKENSGGENGGDPIIKTKRSHNYFH